MEVKHLYIHIPFCNSICTYCDFTRFVCNESIKTKYINKIIRQINLRFDKKNKLDSIYIGGGTPNCLNEQLLNKLLGVCKKLVSTKTEFTIECNPELITKQQALTFKSNKINRISLGIQFCNNKLLKKYGRKTTILSCEQAIRILQSHNISNISGDFIYGLNELTKHDIKSNIEFIKKNKLTHCSFYSLEIKSGSLLNKGGYQINDEKVEEDLSNIEKQLKSIHFNRYEISNWCYNQKYESIHNKAYWLTKE
jgi:oxygen-independent coproporphyrinogen-3 oxidase